jgi:hypothetical protein
VCLWCEDERCVCWWFLSAFTWGYIAGGGMGDVIGHDAVSPILAPGEPQRS